MHKNGRNFKNEERYGGKKRQDEEVWSSERGQWEEGCDGGESEAHGVRTGRSFLSWMHRLSPWRGKGTNRKSALRPQLESKSAGDDRKLNRSPEEGEWEAGLHELWSRSHSESETVLVVRCR